VLNGTIILNDKKDVGESKYTTPQSRKCGRGAKEERKKERKKKSGRYFTNA
jgi:hypothetical protein